MAIIYPDLENIKRLKVSPTPGEWSLIKYLTINLDDTYEVFFNPYLDGDRPDFIILKKNCCAFIIEVKDWNLKNYTITENNKWKVFNGQEYSGKASPQSQVFRYKKNLYDLHLPVIGLKRLANPFFFNLVQCFVYFHGSEKNAIDALYAPAEEKLREKQLRLHQDIIEKKISFNSYEKNREYLIRNKRNLERDKNMSFGDNKLDNLIKKIKHSSRNTIFDEEVYFDFKRRLSPPKNVLNQGIPIKLDNKQLRLTESKEEKRKIKGVAGCGKTSILSQRAINSLHRNNSNVLILTFNITLKNYIRDKISDIQGDRIFSFIEISNYHQFFNAQVNNTEQDLKELIEEHGLDELYSTNVFEDKDTINYQTILIDEIQDYKPEWVEIIRNNFLHKNGEMILFGDESQDIYQRDCTISSVIVKNFGRWIKLAKSYRTSLDSPLNRLFKDFQLWFLLEKHSDTEITDISPIQMSIGFSILRYEKILINGWLESVFNSINNYIRMYSLHPNDVVILTSKISLVRQLSELWIKNEKTHCMFETYEELAICTNKSKEELKKLDDKEINKLITQNKEHVEKIRRTKKNHFYANSGLIKLSTIHSYKGLESKTVFYVMCKEDDAEIVYTSITRSSENLVIFDIGSNNAHSNFLEDRINLYYKKANEGFDDGRGDSPRRNCSLPLGLS